MGDLFDDLHRANTGRLRADQYSFLEHPIAYPPPGDGWFLVTVIAKASGSSSPPDVYHRADGPSMHVSSSTVGVWARKRSDADQERERRAFNHPFDGVPDWDERRRAEYPEHLTRKDPAK